MRKLLMTAILALPALAGLRGQGTVNFNNFVSNATPPIDAPVWEGGFGRLSGAEWLAGLYGGPAGTPASALQLLAPAREFRTGGFVGYVATTGGSIRIVPGVPPGAPATLQIRAWAARSGSSYEMAAAERATSGYSNLITVNTGGVPDPTTGIPSFPANLIGLQGFGVGFPAAPPIVPEPSSLALLLFGGLVLAFTARRKERLPKSGRALPQSKT